MLFSFLTKEGSLTQLEKAYAAEFLADTQQGVFTAVENLSDAQLKFKAAPDKWSVEECVKHTAISEKNL